MRLEDVICPLFDCCRRDLMLFCLVNAIIMCKPEEGYWCNFAIPVKGMKMLEKYLRKDPMLELL